MPTANVRYGRPKGSGLDDSQRLKSIAALLVANPQMKPTTAIRALGVEDASVIRRLREKFRLEQARLMADARRDVRPVPPHSAPPRPAPVRTLSSLTPTPRLTPPARVLALPSPQTVAASKPVPAPVAPADAWITAWCQIGFSAMSIAIQSQTAMTQQWMRLPHVSSALAAQMQLNAVAVAIYTRKAARPIFAI